MMTDLVLPPDCGGGLRQPETVPVLSLNGRALGAAIHDALGALILLLGKPARAPLQQSGRLPPRQSPSIIPSSSTREVLMFTRLALCLLPCLVAASAAKSIACPRDIDPRLLGVRDFTTVVTGTKTGAGVGVNGYYRMQLKQSGCEIQATIVKLGFTGVRFPREKLQYGTFPVRMYDVPSSKDEIPGTALLVDAELHSDNGSVLNVGFTFIGQSGFWRYLGESWDAVGMWGALQTVDIESMAQDRFAAPDKLKCQPKVLKTSTGAVAGLFSCSDLIIATPDLSKALWFSSKDALAPGAQYLDRVVESGVVKGNAYVAYCTTVECDHEGCDPNPMTAKLVATDGRKVVEVQPAASTLKACGVRLPESPAERWDGTIR